MLNHFVRLTVQTINVWRQLCNKRVSEQYKNTKEAEKG